MSLPVWSQVPSRGNLVQGGDDWCREGVSGPRVGSGAVGYGTNPL